MTTMRFTRCCLLLAAVSLPCILAGAEAPAPDPLDELCARIQKNPAAAQEADVFKALELARAANRPLAASFAAKAFLNQHPQVSPALELAAAENAERSGDFRAAVTRYKSYLSHPDKPEAAARVATHMYAVLIDDLDADQEAYDFMCENEDRFREDPGARRFDLWFLNHARAKRQYFPMAKRFVKVLGAKMPLELERMLYWEALDGLMNEVSRGEQDASKAAPALKELAALIRDDKPRAARCAYIAEHLLFQSAAQGKEKDAAALKALFAPVLKAASAYLETGVNAATLRDLMGLWSGGAGRWDGNVWGVNVEEKQAFFMQQVARLPADDRAAIGQMQGFLTPTQWAETLAAHRELFQGQPTLKNMNFLGEHLKDHAKYKAMAASLQGVESYSAAILNSVAAGGADYEAAVAHFLKNESWYLNHPNDVNNFIRNNVWPACANLAQASGKPYAGDYYDKFYYRFGRETIARSVIAMFDLGAIGEYLRVGFYQSGADGNDKSKVPDLLKTLAWVPYSKDDRARVYKPIGDAIKAWAAEKRQNAGADKAKKDAANAEVEPVLKALQEAAADQPGDPAKAPDPLTAKLAAWMQAVLKKNKAECHAAAREVYALVREYNTTKPFLGRFVYRAILDNREGIDNTEFQCEVLADQLAKADDPKAQDRFVEGMQMITANRWQRGSWEWFEVPANERAKAKKFNEVFEKALLAQLDKGVFWPYLFTQFRATRRGPNWNAFDSGLAVMEKLVETKMFYKTSYRPEPWWMKTDTVAYQWFIRNEFPKLAQKYPPESYFDDWYVEEAAKAQYAEWNYFSWGQDKNKKAVNFGAQFFKDLDKLPNGYNEKRPIYHPRNFADWQSRIMDAEPALRDAYLAQVESCYGKTRFDEYAMGQGYFSHQAKGDTPESRKAFFERLRVYLQRMDEVPDRIQPPPMHALSRMGPGGKFAKEELDTLVALLKVHAPWRWQGGWNLEQIVTVLLEGLQEQHRDADLLAIAPECWRLANETANAGLQKTIFDAVKQFHDRKQDDLAAVYASTGLALLGDRAVEDVRSGLQALRNRAFSAVGGAIPLDPHDPRYPVRLAENDFAAGKLQSAWDGYLANKELAVKYYKDLDPHFVTWVISKNTETQQYEASEALARLMLQWMDASPATFDAETRARLMIAYADISFARKEYPRARLNYEKISVDKQFDGTRAQGDADLKVAETDRVTKNYEAAFARLDKLTRRRDAYVETQAYFQMALVKFDQDDYAEAKRILAEQVFTRELNHAQGRLLEGEINLRMKRPYLVTELPVGLSVERQFLVPGWPLKISLEDRNLAVIGKSTNVEIRVWSDSGDEEILNLVPVAESKTKFEGQVPTAMAPPKKGDLILQVLGSDKIHYDFSEEYKKSHPNSAQQTAVLSVASNAELQISSGKILSKEEQAERDLERQIKLSMRLNEGMDERLALNTVRQGNQVKPGNKVYVRVIDPDRNVTPQKDKIQVRVAASSGDRIDAFTLEETDGYSGIFEGAIETAPGQATATASDSKEGCAAQDVLSAEDRPAWIGQPDNRRPKYFVVNLNDNVELGTMTVLADMKERALKSFVVERSLNGTDYTPVGSWPAAFEPWDGSMRVELMKCAPALSRLSDVYSYAGGGYMGSKAPKLILPAKEIAWNFPDASLNGNAEKLGLTQDGTESYYLLHLQASFYQDKKELRTFKLDPKNKGLERIRYWLAVDGKADSDQTPLEIHRTFAKGVHTIDIFARAWRHAGLVFDLQADREEQPAMTLCKGDDFDPAKHPEIKEAVYRAPAKVTASPDGSSFEIAFAKETRTRLVRLTLGDFEKDAPALRKIKLTDAQGKVILPTKQDYLALRQNQSLEMLPGDRIAVLYDDPTVVSKGKELHEAFMSSTFDNAEISACTVEFEPGQGGQRVAKYIPLRRFKPGENINIFISDSDEDTFDAQDKVSFTAKAGGQTVHVEAKETEPHSGVFLGNVFPVAGAPKRATEIQVGPEDDVQVVYLDRENTDPGVAMERSYVVEQSSDKAPKLGIYNVASRALSPEERKAADSQKGQILERVPVVADLVASRPAKDQGDEPARVMADGPLFVELTYPALCLSPKSKATIYVQTASGRERYGKAPKGVFDVNVPGTLKITRFPEGPERVEPAPGYRQVDLQDRRSHQDVLTEGKFVFTVPLELGDVPRESLVDYEPPQDQRIRQIALSIRGNDEIFVGFTYKEGGEQKWIVRKATVASEPMFSVMDSRYQQELAGAHVGEQIYFRLIYRSLDTGDAHDKIDVDLATAGGKKQKVTLTETGGHTGVFKGMVNLCYLNDQERAKDPDMLPVDYGDDVTVACAGPAGKEPLLRKVSVFKGSDGKVLPFTRRYKDPALAVQTQFTIAEAYFELAKRHRELRQNDLAHEEIGMGKKLLEEAIRDNPYSENKMQADFLLADLSFELAGEASTDEEKKRAYQEAANRFGEIVTSYPDSVYAPRAQYKRAMVYKKLGQIDQACEEFVLLACRYPEHELVADTIAQLGEHFRGKALEFEKQASAQTDPVRAEKLKRQGREMFITAAQVFGRMAPRFPHHDLAGKVTVLSASCYQEAESWEKAIETYKAAMNMPNLDKDLKARSMFFCAKCFMSQNKDMDAFHMLRNLRQDYPDTTWGKHARGLLLEDRMLRAEQQEAKENN